MANVRLRTLPIDIDPDAIALGLLDLFTEEERVVLRFGMLPAEKMESLQRGIENKFRQFATQEEGDRWIALMPGRGPDRVIEFSMRELVREAMHLITIQFYEHGELVV